jgi:hypothetical protein
MREGRESKPYFAIECITIAQDEATTEVVAVVENREVKAIR